MMPARLSDFCDEISKTYRTEDPTTFWTCRDPFARLLGSGFLTELLEMQLGYCLSGRGEIVKAANGTSARIALPGEAHLDILLVDPGSLYSSLIGYTSHAMLGYAPELGDVGLVVERYHHAGAYRNDVLDRGAKLTRQPDQLLRGGQVVTVEAGREVFRFGGVARAIPLVVLQSKPCLDFSWQYDAATLAPVQSICPASTAYRLYYSTKLLAEVPGARNAETLLRISHHPSHFVRWAALQALFAVDADAGYARLAAATDDPHPRIRDAAARALQQLERGRRAS